MRAESKGCVGEGSILMVRSNFLPGLIGQILFVAAYGFLTIVTVYLIYVGSYFSFYVEIDSLTNSAYFLFLAIFGMLFAISSHVIIDFLRISAFGIIGSIVVFLASVIGFIWWPTGLAQVVVMYVLMGGRILVHWGIFHLMFKEIESYHSLEGIWHNLYFGGSRSIRNVWVVKYTSVSRASDGSCMFWWTRRVVSGN